MSGLIKRIAAPHWSSLLNPAAVGASPYFVDTFLAEIPTANTKSQANYETSEALNKFTRAFFSNARFQAEAMVLHAVGLRSSVHDPSESEWRVGDTYRGFSVIHRDTLEGDDGSISQIVLHCGAPEDLNRVEHAANDNQIETRTWLAVRSKPRPDGQSEQSCPEEIEVYFGSGLVTRNGAPPSRIGGAFMQALLPFHLWYSRFLFKGALQAMHVNSGQS